MSIQEKSKYIDLLLDEPYKLGHWVGFKDLTLLHNEWIKKFMDDVDRTIQAHRGSYKTTCLAIAMAILMILKPNENTIFTRKTDDDVKEVISTIRNILNHPATRYIISKLYPGLKFEIVKDSATEIHTNTSTTIKGSSQVLGIGINGSITGKHADRVITDDIINLKDRVSKAERDKTKLVYEELSKNIKNPNGVIKNTGTPWHKDDAFTLMPNIEKYDCYTTGLLSKEQIQEIRSGMSSSLFSANYELKHIASEDVLFDNPQFTSNTELIYDGICHIDARYSGKDHTAFSIIKEAGETIYVYGKMYDKHVDECMNDILALHMLYRAGTLYSETNADKGYLARDLKELNIPTKTYHEDMNKHIKIVTYLKGNWNRIVFLDETDVNYLNEILDYNEQAEHDDSPDSLASLIRVIDKGKRKARITTSTRSLFG